MAFWKNPHLLKCVVKRNFHSSASLQIKGKSTFDLIERPNSSVEKEWFKENAELSSRRKNSQGLHFIFLEGSAGCGKNDILNRLSKMGYQTFSKSFVQLFQEYQREIIGNKQPSTVPYFVSLLWTSSLTNYIWTAINDFKNGKTIKDNVIFINRSYLSPFVHFNKEFSFFKESMIQFKQENSTSIILCKSDEIRILERLGGRNFSVSEEEKQIRNILGETNEDDIKAKIAKFEQLEKEDFVDGSLWTTDSKQATVGILRMFDLSFKFKSNPFESNH